MRTFVKGFWVVLFVAVAVDRLRGDELVNVTAAKPQANTNSSPRSLHLNFPPGKDNVEVGNTSSTEFELNNKKNKGGGGGGGGGGAGAGAGGGGGGGGGGGKGRGRDKGMIEGNEAHKKRVFNEDYRIGEFAECMVRTRCRGLRLDCPLHCDGPCVYDCRHMCKAHCTRP
ncbi:glycine-rich RNA-binding protein 2-like [Hibiscus syriacus]|uniref:glycine-rich RNA-binding protein 2-like n=1 Tax=Hibiscus syriacus TaxID=106335 RepID=UPI0019206BD7|nr:glycine-rich RNA-binding protein 2-like [Hibiscus syriacus]